MTTFRKAKSSIPSLVLLLGLACRQSNAFTLPYKSVIKSDGFRNNDHQPPANSIRHSNINILRVSTKDQDQQEGAKISTNGKDTTNKKDKIKIDSSEQSPSLHNSKLRTLKDRMWVREALEDLTAAEFACSLAIPAQDEDEVVADTDTTVSSSGQGSGGQQKKKSAVDFENILAKLDKRIEDMCILTSTKDKIDNSTCIVQYPVDTSDVDGDDDQCWSLKKKYGMGSVTYTDDQRNALLSRILSSRRNLLQAMSGTKSTPATKDDDDDLSQIREKLQTPDAIESDKDINSSINQIKPDLYVREDGTIDWDGALQDREAVKRFGISVWARINGQDLDDVDEDSIGEGGADDSHGEKKVTVKIIETKEIKEKKAILEALQSELTRMDKEHTALLNSAVSAGSAVANVNLAGLDPKLRSEIKESNDELERKKDEVSFQKLNYEMERIYTYLDGELGNTANSGYIPLQDRLNVAEFGLLESQLAAMNSQISCGETIDADVLSVILDQTVDFKRRLGIDYYVAGLTFDKEAIIIWSTDLLEQSKKGIGFYGKGVQLLWNDVLFSTSLIGRAAQGYTLKPREVRTLRRTFKDVLTFIPFVIILIIPLTPIGHVMIFGAIQRFFPDFFPSCFTERRQNLFTLYESTEYSAITIEENWQEKLIRIAQAFGFLIVDSARKALGPVGETANVDDESRIK